MVPKLAILGPFPNAGVATSVGGVAVHGEALAEALRARGNHVTVVSDSHIHEDAFDGYGIRGAMAGTRLKLALTHPLTAAAIAMRTATSVERRALGLPFARSFTRALLLKLALKAASPQVVHVQQADFRQTYLDLAGWSGPVVVTVHGLGSLETQEYAALKRIVPAHVGRATAVTAPSAALAHEIETVLSDTHVDVVPNAVDHELFSPSGVEPSADGAALLYVGRITEFKGAADLLRAFDIVRRTLPDAHLTMVGPRTHEFDGATDVQGLTVVDAAPRADIPGYMTAADLTIVPSHYEGFGLTALESLACGTPVVATEVGGLPEIVDDHVGALVPPSDPDALAATILGLLEDRNRLEELQRTAVERAARFSWDETAAGFERVYASTL